jgi:NhaP-type Na+/H+ or K+/H+ antiporter
MAEDSPEVILVMLFVSLFCGTIITYVLSRFYPDFPYTVVIFGLGILFSVVFDAVHTKDVMKESLTRWDHIPPHLILYVFLPALLFGEAMSLNFHHVKGAIANATLLAGPGAVFGTFAIALMARWVLPYNWSWHLCFLFGSILSATDPVGKRCIAYMLYCSSSY